MPRGSVYRNSGSAWNTITLTGTSAGQTITVPGTGTDLEIVCVLRGDTNAATVNLTVTWNGDTTSANYFGQRAGASGNAAIGPQNNTSVVTVMPALTAATSYFGWCRFFFPQFRNTAMARDMRYQASLESSSSNRAVHSGTFRRTTAGSGALTDAITSVVISPSAGNWIAGSVFRYRVLD